MGKRCVTCNRGCVGVIINSRGKFYMCPEHFNAYSRELDRRLRIIEDRQWGDKEWYREAFPSRFKYRPVQTSLLEQGN